VDKQRTVVSYSEEKFGKKEDPYFYCTNRLDWEVRKIMQTYARRHEVDAFYKDAKQNLGLEEYELRKIEDIKRHLQMILIAHTPPFPRSCGSRRWKGYGLSGDDRRGVQAGVRGDPPLLHPSRVGDRKASKRCKQNPEGAVLVEEAARENEGKCKNPHGRF
jgi:hypothetical protein